MKKSAHKTSSMWVFGSKQDSEQPLDGAVDWYFLGNLLVKTKYWNEIHFEIY